MRILTAVVNRIQGFLSNGARVEWMSVFQFLCNDLYTFNLIVKGSWDMCYRKDINVYYSWYLIYIYINICILNIVAQKVSSPEIQKNMKKFNRKS